MRILGLALIGVLTFIPAASASPAASLGSAFADAYAAFAPLYEFHRDYADYLFAGAQVAVPEGLGAACDAFPVALDALQLALITQTSSAPVEALGYLVRLHGDSVLLCEAFGDGLRALASAGEVDLDTLVAWSDAGLFASIYGMNKSFESTLNAALEAAGNGRERWELAGTFAVRGLLLAPDLARVSSDIGDILYGAPGASAPPFAIPPEVAEAISILVAQAGKPLATSERADVVAAAERIYEYFMSDR
ncbi:MAG: hypothetical protein PHU43_09045 [Candidatus Bipolaricaulis sp.]|nr:hypothetical protein [Candidatus Bipolaricaulis sp.]